MENYKQLVAMQGATLGESTKEDFENSFLDDGFRVKFVEEITTNYVDEKYESINDILFYIHNDDIERFSTWRLGRGIPIRWWEDVCKYNYEDSKNRYNEEVFEKYKPTW